MKYMMIIDKIVQQVVIQRNGDDCDPLIALTSIDMRNLVGDIIGGGGERSKDFDEKYKKQLDKSRKLEKELNAIRDSADKDKGLLPYNVADMRSDSF